MLARIIASEPGRQALGLIRVGNTTFLLPQALLLASSAQLQPVPRQVRSTTLSWQA